MTDDLTPTLHRPIRSFVLRAGRVTVAQQRALDTLSHTYILPYAAEPLNYEATFGRKAPVVLEIGFGMGGTTAAIAAAHPEIDYIAVEVHTPGVGNLLKLIDEQNLSNIRIIQHDAVEVLREMLARDSLSGVHIYFPDPWHKKRHNKRRLIQSPFVSDLVDHLQVTGYLHLATDWEDYAVQMLAVLQAENRLRNTVPGDYAPRPAWRPLTKFEARGLGLGHGVWDLLFARHVG